MSVCVVWAWLDLDLYLLQELNAIFSKPLKELMSAETEVDDAALISIDSKGTDIRVRQGAQVIPLLNNFSKSVCLCFVVVIM